VTNPAGRRSDTDRRRRYFRGWRRVLIATVALFVAFSAVTARLFVWPAEGMPASVSAIVMLAGPGDRLGVALKLAQEHRAPVLVISRGWEGYGGPCPSMTPGVKLVCFDPNPGDTRGEAEYIGQLAKHYRWRSVVLVATRAQLTRARVLVRRCFGGSIYGTTASLPWDNWPYQIAYGWGALLKALVIYRACLRRQPSWQTRVDWASLRLRPPSPGHEIEARLPSCTNPSRMITIGSRRRG
jgi:uncharacterized SAM-binding protein YcdF (DUF218 family)